VNMMVCGMIIVRKREELYNSYRVRFYLNIEVPWTDIVMEELLEIWFRTSMTCGLVLLERR